MINVKLNLRTPSGYYIKPMQFKTEQELDEYLDSLINTRNKLIGVHYENDLH